jgi:hypothetical protein
MANIGIVDQSWNWGMGAGKGSAQKSANIMPLVYPSAQTQQSGVPAGTNQLQGGSPFNPLSNSISNPAPSATSAASSYNPTALSASTGTLPGGSTVTQAAAQTTPTDPNYWDANSMNILGIDSNRAQAMYGSNSDLMGVASALSGIQQDGSNKMASLTGVGSQNTTSTGSRSYNAAPTQADTLVQQYANSYQTAWPSDPSTDPGVQAALKITGLTLEQAQSQYGNANALVNDAYTMTPAMTLAEAGAMAQGPQGPYAVGGPAGPMAAATGGQVSIGSGFSYAPNSIGSYNIYYNNGTYSDSGSWQDVLATIAHQKPGSIGAGGGEVVTAGGGSAPSGPTQNWTLQQLMQEYTPAYAQQLYNQYHPQGSPAPTGAGH